MPSEYPVLFSFGNLIQKKTAQDTHWALWEDKIPKSCYLFALVAGKFHYQESEYINKKKKVTKIEMFVPSEYINKKKKVTFIEMFVPLNTKTTVITP